MVDSYLWVNRSAAMSPQLRAARQAETSGDKRARGRSISKRGRAALLAAAGGGGSGTNGSISSDDVIPNGIEMLSPFVTSRSPSGAVNGSTSVGSPSTSNVSREAKDVDHELLFDYNSATRRSYEVTLNTIAFV
jgi:hypothetical protein